MIAIGYALNKKIGETRLDEAPRASRTIREFGRLQADVGPELVGRAPQSTPVSAMSAAIGLVVVG